MDSGVDPGRVIEETDTSRQQAAAAARDALAWFTDREGEMFPREEVVAALADDLGIAQQVAGRVVSHLVSDVVDPVQQVPHPEERYVGVIAYSEWQDAGAYGYVHYSDRFGDRRRVVCARCVETEELDENISHATQGEGSAPADASWEALVDRVTAHYVAAHDRGPESVEPGASLVSQSTIGGNTAWHAGNDGSGSGLSADDVDGSAPPFGSGDIGTGAVGSGEIAAGAVGASQIASGAVGASEHGDAVDFPRYASLSDVPALAEGEVVYVDGQGGLYVEDGT